MSTITNTNQDIASQIATGRQAADQKTFLGLEIGSFDRFSEARHDWGAIMSAKRVSGADVRAAFAHGVPKVDASGGHKTWADIIERNLLTNAVMAGAGMGMAGIAMLKTDFVKGTLTSKITRHGSQALASATDAVTDTVDGKILSASGNMSKCLLSVGACAKNVFSVRSLAKAVAARYVVAGVAAAVGTTVGAPITVPIIIAALAAPELYRFGKNCLKIALSKDKQERALYGNSVTNKGREFAESMKNDLKHAGEPLDNPPKHTKIVDVKVPDSMKRAAANEINDLFTAKTGLKPTPEGDLVIDNDRVLVSMKNDLKHVGDQLESPPKHTNVLDVKVTEQMKLAAIKEVLDYISSEISAQKTLEAASEVNAKLPEPQVESGKFDHFLEQAASAVENAHAAGETMWQSMPDDLRSRIEAKHSSTHAQEEPEVETTPVAASLSI
ncbi:MAG: hypothetical protein IKZ87_04175 [Actinomycetaceae bacterium]|nr:hypothetical protein [Actinomycetaceae bacterium]